MNFSKWVSCITLSFLLVSCNTKMDGNDIITPVDRNDTTPPIEEEAEEKEDSYYSIAFKNTSEMTDLPWATDLSFEVVQIEYVPEGYGQFQENVNLEIKEATTSWISGKILGADEIDLTITCYSSRYLSFYNCFVYQSRRVDYIKDYVTIDMVTGERVYLSDLVEINEEFVDFLQGETYRMIEVPNPMWQSAPHPKMYSDAELLERLKKCSYTQEQWIEEGYYSIEDSISSLLFKNSFFLREGMLVLTLEQGGEKYLTLDVDDIEAFLKVDKW